MATSSIFTEAPKTPKVKEPSTVHMEVLMLGGHGRQRAVTVRMYPYSEITYQ